jgi:hypothetical protein
MILKHLLKTFKSISINQWFGLILAIIASTLGWIKLVFIISPKKNKKPQLGRYQYYALLISWLITVILWARFIAIIDPLNNANVCNCNCKC